MNQNQAIIPQILTQRGNKLIENVITMAVGVLALGLLAQLAIPLPWTVVPITGQTFGVALIAMTLGRKRALAVVLSYLAMGAAGLPMFALGQSGLSVGPTSGYLIGMVIATYWMGMLADFGWPKTFFRTWLTLITGSLITFSFGVFVLSFFLPSNQLLMAGVLPFIPGDVLKTLIASAILFKTQSQRQK